MLVSHTFAIARIYYIYSVFEMMSTLCMCVIVSRSSLKPVVKYTQMGGRALNLKVNSHCFGIARDFIGRFSDYLQLHFELLKFIWQEERAIFEKPFNHSTFRDHFLQQSDREPILFWMQIQKFLQFSGLHQSPNILTSIKLTFFSLNPKISALFSA